MKRSMLCLFSIICAIVLLHTSFSLAADTIKIGVVDAYTGGAAPMCLDNLNGFKMAVDAVNAKGGVLGKKIVYVVRDDKFKPDVSLAMAKELVMKEKVDILVGTISSAAALAVSDFAKKEKIPFICTGAKSEKITGEKGHRYVFQTDENTAMPGKAMAQVLAKKPYIKYWIAGDDMEYGHAITDAVWNNLKALNPKVQLLGQSWWKVGETDFGPYITAIMSAKPDFLILGNSGASVIGFQKAAKATGLSQAIPLYQHTAIDLTILLGNGLEGPEGVYGTAGYLFYYPQTPENKAFIAEYRKVYNKYPTQPSFYGYVTGEFIAKAYQKAGSTNREKFIDALEGMVLENTAVGRLELRKCDHQIMLPTFVGVTKKVPEYNEFLIATDIVTVSAQDGVPSCEQVLKTRAAAK
ncbi:MAG TPA: ABC transporter substrate-binding protein [Syntrophorhabdales bacterium]|nr:ABC transporter substrate-binding protein [Syntrophorhabdales bacterium]